MKISKIPRQPFLSLPLIAFPYRRSNKIIIENVNTRFMQINSIFISIDQYMIVNYLQKW